jgi:hypothetical protein
MEIGPARETRFEVRSVTTVRTNPRAEDPDFCDGPQTLLQALLR